jgi:type VI secretion system secreted protein VgrG
MSQFYFKFSYQHQGSEAQELTILHFTGQEGISELFNFDLELKSEDIDLNADGVINQSCKIEIYYGDNAKPLRVIHGLINEFEDVSYFSDCTVYRAKMVPRVWQLGHFETNEVYLKETIEQTLTVILEEASFVKNQDFRFELSRTYRPWPFRLQYNETHLDYLQRIIEREGIYYYFEHKDDADVIVFCDNNQALPRIEKSSQANNVVFQANSSVYVDSDANTINSIICKRHTLPKKVTLRDFNDETPSLDIRGEFVINSTGVGDINLYGLNIVSPEEGQALAEIHANAYLSHQKAYIGQGDVANMIVGHKFTLQDHPRDSFNELDYLLEGIEHEGANLNQYQAIHTDVSAPVNYSNSFNALSTEHEYAPKRQRIAPEINGTLNAVIDTEADSGYAELDDTGRYKVKLPFDRKDRNGGKASHWVRMMQPYGGANEGMHFPLRNGTRVLLGFIGGDPDRPFISGTINDSGDQQSVVTADNQTNNVIKTASGNKVELEDKEGRNRIKLETGDNKTYMHLGSPNHPGDGFVLMSKGIQRQEMMGGKQITLVTKHHFNYATGVQASSSFSGNDDTKDIVTEQDYFEFPIKSSDGDGSSATADTFTPNVGPLAASPPLTFPGNGRMTRDIELSGFYLIERTIGDKYIFENGNEYEFNSPGDMRFMHGADREVVLCQMDDMLDLNYSVNNIVDPNSNPITYRRHNQNLNRDLTGGDDLIQKISDLRQGLSGYQSFSPTSQADENGIVVDNYYKCDGILTENQWNDLLDNKSQTSVARHNTFSIQEGNIFDFGGYWNYNLGNSYTETHGLQTTTINKLSDKDRSKNAGPHWKKITGKHLTFTQQGDEQVEKSYSNQYSYTEGNTIEVHDGDAESQHYGKSYDYHKGDSYDEHKGDSYSIQHGRCDEFFMGGKSEFNLAATTAMSLAVTSDIHVLGANDIFLGVCSDISVAIKSEVSAGQVLSVTAGMLLEVNAAIKMETELNKVQANATDIKNHAAKMSAVATQVDNAGLELTTAGTALCSGLIRMFC